MILMTPLSVPKIQPNNWDEWWSVWNTYSGTATKQQKNQNDAVGSWKGMDLETNSLFKMPTVYSVPKAPSTPVTDDIIRQIKAYIPVEPIVVRVIENLDVVPAHTDNSVPVTEIRCMLWNNYQEPVWEFNYLGEKRKLLLPESTNTFFYKDCPLTHSSIFKKEFTKGVMVIYGIWKPALRDLVINSAEEFKEVSWVV
jgi:hypothetical protein